MTRLYLKLICTSIVLICMITACKHQNFSSSEEQRIQNFEHSDSIMRLYTINNQSDSIVLRQVSRNIKPSFDKETLQLLKERMLSTVKDPENMGVGIAAPQVGISVQLICVQRFDKNEAPFEFYMNPEITSYNIEEAEGAEGCLSVPEQRGLVSRSTEIVIQYQDDNFDLQTETVSGFTAVIFQHEIDHLNGQLFIDYLQM